MTATNCSGTGRIALGVLLGATLGAANKLPAQASTPTTVYACYVPITGIVYRIKTPGAPQACARSTIEFSWNDAGPTGPTGDPGPQGQAGNAGAAGVQGAPGAVGAQGPTGAPGDKGVTGPVGTPGATGPQGDQGPIGVPGLPGLAGPPGDKGPPGPAGLAGVKGVPGAPGMVGAPGSVGPSGDKGDQGPQGDPGQTGPKGLPGGQGGPGPQGTAGPPGAAGPAGGSGILSYRRIIIGTGTVLPNVSLSSRLFCMANEHVVGGGWQSDDPSHPLEIHGSYPIADQSWQVNFSNPYSGQLITGSTYAICVSNN